MKPYLFALCLAPLLGCVASTPTPVWQAKAPAPEHVVEVHQLAPPKVAGVAENQSPVISNDEDENPYDALIVEEEQAEADAAKTAAQAEQDKKLHDLMVKAVWGDCKPYDPLCSTVNNQPEVKADQK